MWVDKIDEVWATGLPRLCVDKTVLLTGDETTCVEVVVWAIGLPSSCVESGTAKTGVAVKAKAMCAKIVVLMAVMV